MSSGRRYQTCNRFAWTILRLHHSPTIRLSLLNRPNAPGTGIWWWQYEISTPGIGIIIKMRQLNHQHLKSVNMKTRCVLVTDALLVLTCIDMGSLNFGLLSKTTRAKCYCDWIKLVTWFSILDIPPFNATSKSVVLVQINFGMIFPWLINVESLHVQKVQKCVPSFQRLQEAEERNQDLTEGVSAGKNVIGVK